MPRYSRVEPLTPPSPSNFTWVRSGMLMSASLPSAPLAPARIMVMVNNNEFSCLIKLSRGTCQIAPQKANNFLRCFRWHKCRRLILSIRGHRSRGRIEPGGDGRGGHSIQSPSRNPPRRRLVPVCPFGSEGEVDLVGHHAHRGGELERWTAGALIGQLHQEGRPALRRLAHPGQAFAILKGQRSAASIAARTSRAGSRAPAGWWPATAWPSAAGPRL